jgi:hypothetical protein
MENFKVYRNCKAYSLISETIFGTRFLFVDLIDSNSSIECPHCLVSELERDWLHELQWAYRVLDFANCAVPDIKCKYWSLANHQSTLNRRFLCSFTIGHATKTGLQHGRRETLNARSRIIKYFPHHLPFNY